MVNINEKEPELEKRQYKDTRFKIAIDSLENDDKRKPHLTKIN